MLQSVEVDEFLKGDVIIDVRTPAEFESGHIIGAINIPLFTNEERAVVGTLYVRKGREQAIEKGLEFVGPRMADMVRQAKKTAAGRAVNVHCWRGGMRSGSVGWLLSTAGLDVNVLKGGYKAYRHSFEQMLDEIPWKIILLAGSTGSGKTELLHHIADSGEQVLDLEGLANHKGSAFGGIGQPQQPTTEQFINKLHHRFREFDPSKQIWCEGESILIGHVFMPQKLYDLMRHGLQIEIEMSVEQRLDRLMVEYGNFSAGDLIASFEKIRKRFGFDQTKQAIELVGQGEIRAAATMALKYYDKAYKKNAVNEIVFKADNSDMSLSAERLSALVTAQR